MNPVEKCENNKSCLWVCGMYLCKIDGSATKASGTHFIECLYRPPVTRVGVDKTADQARANYYCCGMSNSAYLLVMKGANVTEGWDVTEPTFKY